MPQIRWSQFAIDDLLTVVSYIADENPAAAQAINDEVNTKVSNLAVHPRMGRIGRVEGTRELVIRSNYIAVYQDGEKEITILRLLHSAQMWP